MKISLNVGVYKKIWIILSKKQKKALILLLFLVVIGTMLETVSIGVIIPVLNMFSDNKQGVYDTYKQYIPFLDTNEKIQIFLISLLIFVYVVKGVFLSFLTWYQNRFSFGLTADISNRLFQGYLMRDYVFHLNRKSSDLIRNITTEVGTFTSVLLAGIVVLSEISIVCSIIILLFVINPFGAIVSFVLLSILGSVFSMAARKYNVLWGSQRHIHDSIKIKIILQAFDGIKEIKHYCKEHFFVQQYIDNNNKIVKPTEKQYTLQSMPRIFFEVIAVIVCLSYVLVQVMVKKDIESIIPQVGLLIAAAFRLMPSFNRIISSMQTFRFAETVINNLNKEAAELQIHENFVQEYNNSSDLTIRQSITLDEISFRYNTDRDVFYKTSLTIKAHEFIAIVGKSGAGKSTMIDLMLGLLKPYQGAIRVDGKDISKNLNAWRKLVGYVPQSYYLFDDTIKYNITFGETDTINQEQLNDALELAQLSSFIQELPQGVNTVIGEKGSQLSGGQKQRLAIARALYLKPKVLILDEPTSALDNTTEKELMQSLSELRKKIDITIILITHSISNLRYCDRIFEIKDKHFHQISENS